MVQNTTLSGSGRVDDIQGHPLGELRGQTKLVNIADEVIRPTATERSANPRSGSAKLRWSRRSGEDA